MAESAVVENLTRTRARAIQDRADSAEQKVSTRRRWRIPELAIGVVLMCGGALGAILLSRSGDSMVVVVGSARNLERGVQITAQDLVALEVPSSFATSFVMGENAKSLIGQTMLINLNASSPITTAMLSPTVGLLAGVRGEWHSYERAVKADSWANSQPSQKLVNLYSKINSGSPVLLAR